MKHYKVIFTDLDGTLIDTLSGSVFPKGIWDMKLKFNVLDRIASASPELIAIVTNQGGIEKGFVNERNFVKGKMAFITRAVEEYTGIPCIYQHCSVNDEKCPYRKPNTGMLDTVTRKDFSQHGIEASKEEMLMIGDASGKKGQFSDSDLRTAVNFGIDYMDVDDFIAAE